MRVYSAQAKRLATEVRDKAIRNLKANGRTVLQDSVTGRITVLPRSDSPLQGGDEISQEAD